MAKTRKGMKGKKGRPEEGPKKSFDRVAPKNVDSEKRKRDGEAERPKGKKYPKGPNWNKKTVRTSRPKVGEPEVDEKQTKRTQIIQKKRMARRDRRQGA
jgi:nucleolar protein 4